MRRSGRLPWFEAGIALVGALSAAACGAEPSNDEIDAQGAAALASERPGEHAIARELARRVAPRHAAWLAARVGARARAGDRRGVGQGAPRLALPEHAHEPFHLSEPTGQVGVAVQLVGTEAVGRERLGSLSLYAGALGAGSALMLQPTEHGVEDYVAFATAPPTSEIEYRIELGASVAGLRSIASTLELLDASGVPRLRVSPPHLLGADGARASADVSVLGCAVDRHPAPPRGRPRVAPGARECRLRVAWSSDAVSYPALLDPRWTLTSSLSEPRLRFASVVLADGRVLAAGGASSDGGAPIASAEIYDPASGTWAVTGSLSTGRSAFTLSALTLASGLPGAIAIGGQGPDVALDGTELYDPIAGSWLPGPPLPVASAAHAALQLGDASILVAGGTSRASSRLVANASRWEPAGSLLADEPGASLTLLDDGSALLVGPNSPRAQRYRPAERVWVPSGEPAIARSGHSATRLLDGQVLLVGGSPSQRAELFDPTRQRFRFTGGTSEAHARHSATLLADGRVAIVGGASPDGAGGAELYEPTWGVWTPGPGTTTPRAEHRAERLGDGRVLVFGGVDAGAVLPSAELLDAASVAIHESEYKLPPRVDASVTAHAFTELWASITRPATLGDGQRYPLLLFLHGNHATCGTGANPRRDFDCSYTARGSCPAGHAVVPSHRGYDYASRALAARGFIVVSVNANRGITCGDGEEGDIGFNLARGRLLLRHLQQLAEWDRGESETPATLGASLAGKLALSELGVMGHSRGGEGARAAYELYREAGSPWPRRIVSPLVFRAIFEIAPVDGQTSRVLNADGTAWAVLLPLCDGDVSDLQGVRPFDRMLGLFNERRDGPKSTFVAWGTNHNYFNTEWQESDSPGCENHAPLFSSGAGITGSAEQRQIALRSLLAFFSANVGSDSNRALNELFDPTSPLGTGTRIDRGHTPGLRPSRGITLEDFSGPTGSSAHGLPLLRQNIELEHGSVPEHDPELRAASIEWLAGASANPEAARFLELPLSTATAGIDLGAYTHLELRAGRLASDALLEPTPLIIQLVNADGSRSEPVDAADHGLRLDGPVGGPYGTHLVLQTARLPFAAFAGAAREALRAVRFEFPGAGGAHLYLANVRASLGSASLSPATAERASADGMRRQLEPAGAAIVPGLGTEPSRELSRTGNSIVALRAVDARVEIELRSAQPFHALDDHLVLDMGPVRASGSRHPDGDLTRVVFGLTAAAFAAAPDGETLRVRYATNERRQWEFGALDKSRLAR